MASHHSCCGVCRLRQHGGGCGLWRGGGIGVDVFVEAVTMLRDMIPTIIGGISGVIVGALVLWLCGF